MDYDFRIFDFHLYNKAADQESSDDDSSGDGTKYKKNTPTKNLFTVQMFGKNEAGESCSITVGDFKPFFYVKVGDNWGEGEKISFVSAMRHKLGTYHQDNLISCDIVRHKKLYEFDDGKKNTFILCKFENLQALNKMKNLWYDSERRLLVGGFYISILGRPTKTEIYESFIPPLLRFFHIRNISPSGWIRMPRNKTHCVPEGAHETTCDHEFEIMYADIEPLREKEDRVPLKILSFDIEASSSHGDFPVPVKGYKKLATNVVDLYGEHGAMSLLSATDVIRCAARTAFGFSPESGDTTADTAFEHGVDLIYVKGKTPTVKKIATAVEKVLAHHIEDIARADTIQANSIEAAFGRGDGGGEDACATNGVEDGDEWSAPSRSFAVKKAGSKKSDNPSSIADLLASAAARDTKLSNLIVLFDKYLPAVEGDKVTFIGSTLQEYGDDAPYYNHCIALDTCDDLDMEDTEIECYKTEREVLMAWRDFVVREDPDIIIGYNIFGFDYNFMFLRARELRCAPAFLEMSKIKDHLCGTIDKETGEYNIEHSNITIASGTHELGYIKMPGRIQLDLYNHFRREENLVSYKLDYVAGHFIGDYVSDVAHSTSMDETTVKTKNMAGLLVGSYVHFEEIGHSTDYYDGGAKFQVTHIDNDDKSFTVSAHVTPDQAKKVRWALAKDDVTPKDIFRLTNEGSAERAIVAKYCIQDCNLVQYLLTKVDALTGMIEMANICSVPINFLILRGQGIKLTSYVGKKCREKDTLIPDIEKKENDGGYEGAIVLDPKSDLYMDNPVACVDYASLYPSSMISENLSHDSKVWTREYNLDGKLIAETGETDGNGEFIYDNLPGYSYVDIDYDTYKYARKSPSAAATKTKCGSKTCRFAQFPDGKRAIMPSILEELLKARKATRKLIPQQTDEFMKSVLDKRQLAYKLTANSLYGQCGARTSTFYEKDVAASTTATGRKLLTYAKRVIEEVYGDAVMDTLNHGKVRTKAEYVYGDSVANYTPVQIRVRGEMVICTISDLVELYGDENGWSICREEGKQDKEFCELLDVESWTETGWTTLHRVIRHRLASHKKMMRVLTHTGVVDVTDDHSLLLNDGTEVSPKDIEIGSKCLHRTVDMVADDDIHMGADVTVEEAMIYGFFFGDGSCGAYDCPSGKKASWALNNANETLLEKYMDLCRRVYPTYTWTTYNTIASSGVYKISFNTEEYGEKKRFVDAYRKAMYNGKSKIVPTFIMNGRQEIREAFWEGLYDADGDKDPGGYTRIDQKSQLSSAHICWLANSIGYKTSLNTRTDKLDIYRITATRGKQRKCPNEVKKIHDLPDYGDEYVYDLTTDNHHFAAGVGNMIVHNTDSVFFTFNLENLDGKPIRGKDALEITIELSQEAGALASKFLKKPHDLEYEKTFMPFCLLSKKRYVGMLYEHDPNKGNRKEMGIVLKRRDNAPIVKDIYGGIIDILMKEGDNLKPAIDFLKESVQNLVDEKYPMDKLIISKSIRSDYKNPKQIAHKVLADRMTARDPGNKPASGDRIPYVYIHNPARGALQGDKIENPTYIVENNLKIDYAHYITNQVMKPVQQVFALVLEKIWMMQNKRSKLNRFRAEVASLKQSAPPEKFQDRLDALRCREIKALLFDTYIHKANNQKQGFNEMTSYFGKL